MGLPNITGTWFTCGLDNAMGQSTGAFSPATWGGNGYNAHGYKAGAVDYINFNASHSSAIYGNSSTVTPLSLSTKLILKY